MKIAIFFLASTALVFALPRSKRQIFGFTDPEKVPAMLNSKSLVDNYVNCLKLSEAEAQVKCDRIAMKLRETIPQLIALGDCPSACTQKEKVAMAKMVKILQEKYPEHWKTLIELYKITPEQLKKLNEHVTQVLGSTPAA